MKNSRPNFGRRFLRRKTLIEKICDKTQSLKDFTDNHCAQASFVFTCLLKDREIKVNGKKIGENVLLQAGDTVQYYLTEKQMQRLSYSIVYEDENVIIADKESGVNSEAVFEELYEKQGGRCAFIHRLDRNTRGLIVFAKTGIAEKELLAAFKEKRVEKRYHALCFGAPKKSAAVLTAYLKKDAQRSEVKIFDVAKTGAEKIITEYKLIEEKAGLSKLEIVLHTGKTHQIRAHLAHVGLPIVGDMKYGDTKRNREQNATRQQLVAKELSFSFDGVLSYLNGKRFRSKFEL